MYGSDYTWEIKFPVTRHVFSVSQSVRITTFVFIKASFYSYIRNGKQCQQHKCIELYKTRCACKQGIHSNLNDLFFISKIA